MLTVVSKAVFQFYLFIPGSPPCPLDFTFFLIRSLTGFGEVGTEKKSTVSNLTSQA